MFHQMGQDSRLAGCEFGVVVFADLGYSNHHGAGFQIKANGAAL
jgi:hypothetical protein